MLEVATVELSTDDIGHAVLGRRVSAAPFRHGRSCHLETCLLNLTAASLGNKHRTFLQIGVASSS